MDLEEYVLPEEYSGSEGVVFRRKRGMGTGRLWYAALVPLFGIYIEMYADSFPLGVLVWVLAIVMGPAACLLDRRHIAGKGIDVSSLRPAYALLPPLYIFKRTKLTNDQRVCGIVWCIMAVYALFMNGFTGSALMDETSMIGAVRDGYWSGITETEDVSCEKTIGETLAEMGGELEWSALRAEGHLAVRCTGKTGFRAVFKIDFDGYAVGKYHLDTIVTDGKTYDGEDAAKLIKERYKKDDSSAAAESSSESAADASVGSEPEDAEQAA